MKFLGMFIFVIVIFTHYAHTMSPTGALALLHIFNPELLETRFRCLTCGVFVPAAGRKAEYVSGSRIGFLCRGCVKALERRPHSPH